MIGRRSLLLAGAALPASVSAYGQCVTDTMVVDACLGGVRRTVPAGMTFERNFMTGSLGAGAVFTRASTAAYTNASGVLVSAANDTPRFDYDPVTLQLKGVLLEDASTNLMLQSADASNAAWQKFGSGTPTPVATANQTVAPDGTTTAARVVFGAVSGAQFGVVYQNPSIAAVSHAFSCWLKGSIGGEQLYVSTDNGAGAYYASPRLTLTTQWQRFSLITPALTAGTAWLFKIGTDLRDPAQAGTPAQTIYAWGAQVEAVGYTTSYIPTTAAPVTRAADGLRYPIASVTGFDATKGTLAHEYYMEGTRTAFASVAQFVGVNVNLDWINIDQMSAAGGQPTLAAAAIGIGGATQTYCNLTAAPVALGAVHRGASAWALGSAIIGTHDGMGSTVGSGVASSLPVLANLTVGGPANSQAPISQWARRVRYWPRQLSQAELASVTS